LNLRTATHICLQKASRAAAFIDKGRTGRRATFLSAVLLFLLRLVRLLHERLAVVLAKARLVVRHLLELDRSLEVRVRIVAAFKILLVVVKRVVVVIVRLHVLRHLERTSA